MDLTVALALDEAGRLPADHFGQAHHYGIFTLTDGQLVPVAEVANPFREQHHDEGGHHHHGGKTAGIAKLLAEHGVDVVVSRQWGHNVGRMARRFVPVIVRDDTVEAVAERLWAGRDQLTAALAAGEARKPVSLRE